MKRFILSIISMTALGLIVVYGEVEAMKIGYDIRQLNIRKHEVKYRIKESEIEIASLTAPENLLEKMVAQQVTLVDTKPMRIARLDGGRVEGDSKSPSGFNALFTRFFVSSAQAGTKQ